MIKALVSKLVRVLDLDVEWLSLILVQYLLVQVIQAR